MGLGKIYVAWPRVRRDGSPEAYARKILVRSHLDETRRPWRRERSSSQLLEPSGGGSPQPAPEGDCEAVPAPMPEMPELTRIEAALTDVLDPTGDHLTSFPGRGNSLRAAARFRPRETAGQGAGRRHGRAGRHPGARTASPGSRSRRQLHGDEHATTGVRCRGRPRRRNPNSTSTIAVLGSRAVTTAFPLARAGAGLTITYYESHNRQMINNIY